MIRIHVTTTNPMEKLEIAVPWVQGLKLIGNVALDKYIQQGKTWTKPWYVYSWDYSTYQADGVTPVLTKVQKRSNHSAYS